MNTRPLLLLVAIALLASCTRAPSMAPAEDQSTSNIRIVRHYYDTWGADAIDGAVEDVKRDAILHKEHGALTVSDWMEAQTWLTMTAPDARYSIDAIAAHGPYVTVQWRLHGTDTEGWLTGSDGRAFQLTGTTVERLDQGKVVELWCADIPELHGMPAGEPGRTPSRPAASDLLATER
jgi:hypothetical protein